MIEEALEILKGNITKAVGAIVEILEETKNDYLRRQCAKDVIDYTIKAREFEAFDARISALEVRLLKKQGAR